MSKVFEDEFMEVQTDMISLCCELTKNTVDGIYVYCSCEGGAREFNAFFTKQGKIVFLHELGVDRQTQSNFLDIGLSDLRRIKNICQEYNQVVPTEMKLIYDVKTRKFSASYQYQPVQTMDIGFMDLMKAWANEVSQNIAVEDLPKTDTVKPTQTQPQPKDVTSTPNKSKFRFPFFGKRDK